MSVSVTRKRLRLSRGDGGAYDISPDGATYEAHTTWSGMVSSFLEWLDEGYSERNVQTVPFLAEGPWGFPLGPAVQVTFESFASDGPTPALKSYSLSTNPLQGSDVHALPYGASGNTILALPVRAADPIDGSCWAGTWNWRMHKAVEDWVPELDVQATKRLVDLSSRSELEAGDSITVTVSGEIATEISSSWTSGAELTLDLAPLTGKSFASGSISSSYGTSKSTSRSFGSGYTVTFTLGPNDPPGTYVAAVVAPYVTQYGTATYWNRKGESARLVPHCWVDSQTLGTPYVALVPA